MGRRNTWTLRHDRIILFLLFLLCLLSSLYLPRNNREIQGLNKQPNLLQRPVCPSFSFFRQCGWGPWYLCFVLYYFCLHQRVYFKKRDAQRQNRRESWCSRSACFSPSRHVRKGHVNCFPDTPRIMTERDNKNNRLSDFDTHMADQIVEPKQL